MMNQLRLVWRSISLRLRLCCAPSMKRSVSLPIFRSPESLDESFRDESFRGESFSLGEMMNQLLCFWRSISVRIRLCCAPSSVSQSFGELFRESFSLAEQVEVPEEIRTLMVVNFLGGLAGIPSVLFLNTVMENTVLPMILFAAACAGVFLTKMMETAVDNRTWCRCVTESTIAIVSFGLGGGIPMFVESFIPSRSLRIVTSVGFTIVFGGGALYIWNRNREIISWERVGKIVLILVAGVAIITWISHMADKATNQQ